MSIVSSAVGALCVSIAADARLAIFEEPSFDFLLTIKERIDFAPAPLPPVIRIERGVDPAQHDMQRHAALLPRFNQRPIERRDPDMTAAPLHELIFDFSKVVVVIHEERRLRTKETI